MRPWARLLGVLILVAATGAAGWGWLLHQGAQWWPLRTIRIEGTIRHLRPADLEQAVAPQLQAGFFRLDAKAVQDAALALPWVRGVTVRRVWPDVLLLWVDEQIPFARWGADGLVTADGVVFRPRPEEIPGDLPLLEGGDDEAAEVTEAFRQMQAKVAPLGLRIAALRLDRRGAWAITFANGLELRLGTQQRDERLGQFVRVFPVLAAHGLQGAERRQPIRIDMRYANGMAVQWQVEPPAPAGRV